MPNVFNGEIAAKRLIGTRVKSISQIRDAPHFSGVN